MSRSCNVLTRTLAHLDLDVRFPEQFGHGEQRLGYAELEDCAGGGRSLAVALRARRR